MSKIKSIGAREIKDSRGNPTVEVELETEKGSFVASCPSGASTGKNEALELRDAEGPDGGRTDGKGVQNAISNINDIIAKNLKGRNPEKQKEIDEIMIELDGTENKSKLGANAILAVSMAVCRAGAGAKKVPLYRHIKDLSVIPGLTRNPGVNVNTLDSRFRGNDKKELGNDKGFKIPLAMFNILEGGKHVSQTEKHLAIQEFMIVPQKSSFAENLVICNTVFNSLKEILKKNYSELDSRFRGNDISNVLGDEGGFAPQISKTEQALFLLKNAIGDLNCKIAIDCAASEFFENGKYKIDGREFTKAELLEFYEDLIKRFPIISIEDPFDQEDWEGFKQFYALNHGTVMIVGDDLTTTNIKRIKEAHNKNACNGVILKLNQIGTVSETIEACNLAKSFEWKTIVSHRSGETMDNFIADLAVGLSTDFIKSGSPAKEERMVKYSRLLEIEREIF